MAKPYSLNPEPVRGVIIAPIIAVIVLLTPVPTWIVEDFYSRDMYPWLQSIATGATNLLPLALLDVLLIGVAFAVFWRLRRLWFVTRQRGIMDALWEAARRIVRVAAVAAILFYWGWGFNYRRIPLETVTPGGKAQALTVDMLQSAFSDAGTLASRLRPMTQAHQGNFHTIRLDLEAPMTAALTTLGRVPLKTSGQPKTSLVLTPFFRASGVTGMINPFGLESIVSPDLLPFERPFVLAHEWAHLSGHADEAEASAVGWLACMKGGAVLGYSGSLYLLLETSRAMPAAAREKAMARLDAGVRADLDAIEARLQTASPSVERTTSRVYDRYLRANRVADGTASYGRALKLILSSPFREALSGYTLAR